MKIFPLRRAHQWGAFGWQTQLWQGVEYKSVRHESGVDCWRHGRDMPYTFRVEVLGQPQALLPVTEAQRYRMQFPATQGVTEETPFDARLSVITADACEAGYVFEAYFLQGEFSYAGWFGSPGAPNSRCLGEDYRSRGEFLNGAERIFGMRSDEDFLRLFRELPVGARTKIRGLF